MPEINIICDCCGLALVLADGVSVIDCPACGVRNARPRVTGPSLDMLRHAVRQRLGGDFANAERSYQQVLLDFPDAHEALWGRLLCHYGVEYVEDPATRRLMPTVHTVRRKPLRTQPEFRDACEFAPGDVRARYEQEAAYIDDAQAAIRLAAASCPPYDVFICHKTTKPGTGEKTEDFHRAYQLFTYLEKQGLRPFFAPECLMGFAGADYEAGIYHAIETAKVMLLLCSDPAYLTSAWVRSEWSRFIERIDEGADKRIVPLLYDGFDAHRLPAEIRYRRIQGFPMGELTSTERLMILLRDALGKTAPAPAPIPPVTPAPTAPVTVPPTQPAPDTASNRAAFLDATMGKAGPAPAAPVKPTADTAANRAAFLDATMGKAAPAPSAPAKPASTQPAPDTAANRTAFLDATMGKAAPAPAKPAPAQPASDTAANRAAFLDATMGKAAPAPSAPAKSAPTQPAPDTAANRAAFLDATMGKSAPAPAAPAPAVPAKPTADTAANRAAFLDATMGKAAPAPTAPAKPAPAQPAPDTAANRAAFLDATMGKAAPAPIAPAKPAPAQPAPDTAANRAAFLDATMGKAAPAPAAPAPAVPAKPTTDTAANRAAFLDATMGKAAPAPAAPAKPTADIAANRAAFIEATGTLYEAELRKGKAAGRPVQVSGNSSVRGSVSASPASQQTVPFAPESHFTVQRILNGSCIVKYTGPGGVVRIPAMLDGRPVENIGPSAFKGCKTLTGVILPEGVTHICDQAFMGCSNLSRIDLPKNLIHIGDSAFDHCINLTAVTLPQGLKQIKAFAFQHCHALKSINIPDNVTIGTSAFHDCRALPEATREQAKQKMGFITRLNSLW